MTSHKLGCRVRSHVAGFLRGFNLVKKRQSNLGIVIFFQTVVLSLFAGPQTIVAQHKQDLGPSPLRVTTQGLSGIDRGCKAGEGLVVRLHYTGEKALRGYVLRLGCEGEGTAGENRRTGGLKRDPGFEEKNMKRFLYLAAATIAISLIATPIYAQGDNLRLRFHVPFPFSTQNSSFPAGEYEITMPAQTILEVRNRTGQAKFIRALPGSSKDADGTVKVVFHRYGSEYFLSVVSTGPWMSTYRLQVSKEERRIAEESPRPTLNIVSLLVDGTTKTTTSDKQ